MPPSDERSPADSLPSESRTELPVVDRAPDFMGRSSSRLTEVSLRGRFTEACHAWLSKSPSKDTRTNYARDVNQFLAFIGVDPTHLEVLASVRPAQVAAWRDKLRDGGLTNSSIVRKMTAVRSLYSY